MSSDKSRPESLGARRGEPVRRRVLDAAERLLGTGPPDFSMRELASLIGAGQDLDRALRLVAEEAPNRRVSRVVGRIHDAVRNGAALATALQAEPRSFPAIVIGLVKAGEAGGDQVRAVFDALPADAEVSRSNGEADALALGRRLGRLAEIFGASAPAALSPADKAPALADLSASGAPAA